MGCGFVFCLRSDKEKYKNAYLISDLMLVFFYPQKKIHMVQINTSFYLAVKHMVVLNPNVIKCKVAK